MSRGTLNRNICKDSKETNFKTNGKIVNLCFSYTNLSQKRFNAIWIIIILEKTKCANDLKFYTKISGINRLRMVNLSGKIIFNPSMSKNLSGVSLKIHNNKLSCIGCFVNRVREGRLKQYCSETVMITFLILFCNVH
jgi:hypothetical protein